jgi:hypothetical protein
MAEFDPETASMNDLRLAAEAEALAASTNTAVVVDPPAAVVVPPVVTGPFFAERSIDLGDGAGIQVFKGKGTSREEALENLSDSLAEAQTHATKKIRELSKAKPVEQVVNKDDDALLAAQLLSTPSAALEKLFRDKYGDPEEIKQAVAESKATKAAKARQSVAEQFVTATPDFLDNQRNGQLINKWLTLNNDFSLDGFKKAYTDLHESGLLQVKGVEAGDEQKKAEAEAQRIADAAEAASSQRTKRSSGISTQRKTAAPVAAEPSEEDMYALPLAEIRKRANQQLAASR